ncbi:Phosphotransferase family protein [Metarhizium acridum CQMa 102]|uniref:Phosphotransferase family protein n=2 Tax=Metarhizium acridum TaxID=92637 RepID=E9DYU6_METAQ|nr:Phosphotransferase family protein [Metarhizium acridum CQMa 102]EFY91123.1 Phosphotransferase family protein [Metarhizium acridum CQMa 102]
MGQHLIPTAEEPRDSCQSVNFGRPSPCEAAQAVHRLVSQVPAKFRALRRIWLLIEAHCQTNMAESTDEDVAAVRSISYPDAVDKNLPELYYFMGIRVLEHTTSNGDVLALKVKSHDSLARSEADMMQFAATHGILAPKVRGCYDIVTMKPQRPLARVLVAERVPGESLDTVWDELSKLERESIKKQLREQFALMRSCTQPYIGRVDKQPTYNVYDRLEYNFIGPFEDEEAFDTWCLNRLGTSDFTTWRMRRFLEKSRARSKAAGTANRFVLTHGDLSPRNVMVENGRVTGIVDWERSGFFPEYAEYAFALKLGHEIEKWWIPVLKELLVPCEKKRLNLTKMVEYRGW